MKQTFRRAPVEQFRNAPLPTCWPVAPALLAMLLVGCSGSDGSDPAGATAGAPKNADAVTSKIGGVQSGQAPAPADNLVVRNSDYGMTSSGPFQSIDGYLQRSAKTLLAHAGTTGATADFPAPITQDGYYEVFVWWPQSAPAASAARVDVRHADGSNSQTLDQTSRGGAWNSIGTFRFDRKQKEGPGVRFGQVVGAPLLVDAVRYQFVGSALPELTARTTDLAVGQAQTAYTARVEAAGGRVPYRFTLADTAAGLPSGLALDAATGVISGTPAQSGTYAFDVMISDAAGGRATQAFKLHVTERSVTRPAPRSQPGASRAERSKDGAPSGAAPDMSSLLSVIAALPEGAWSQVGLNSFSDAWTPPDLRPLFGVGNPAPDRILEAWSSVAWDPNRGQLILYGGGHANYGGNDVYLWKGKTRRWERGSLPSERVQDDLGYWRPADGMSNAPSSAHTYDNQLFLPILDRFLTFGGATDDGGHYATSESGTRRITGPYLFDPSRADPNKVGGTTGSHVQREGPHPEVTGGQMWQNRENGRNPGYPGNPWDSFANGCTAYAQENGKDVVYVRYGVGNLYRYVINSLADTTQDTWEKVGIYWGGPGAKAVCGMDPVGKTFVRTAVNSVPFVYWDLNAPGRNNRDVQMTPADPGGQFTAYMASGARNIADCGFDFDPKRRNYALWCGDGRVWTLKPPATPSPTGWVITQQPTPQGAVPNGNVATGILGKWKYIDNLDVFMGVQDSYQGNIWVYKPVGWVGPGGTPPPTAARTNWALASSGSTWSASSTYSLGYPPVAAGNGDRKGTAWGGGGGGWNDGTPNAYPDALEVNFGTPRTVAEIDVYSVQDNFPNPVEPTDAMTFSLYGITNFDVQYWDGANWLTVNGGSVTGNNRVVRRFAFPPVTTSRVRVLITGSLGTWSRITELEAWSTASQSTGPEMVNFAAATNGGSATASSTHSSRYAVAGAIDGNRTGSWGNGGGWNDATPDAWSDWLQVNFSGIKSISEVDLFTLQDNYNAPQTPTESMTFSLYGLTAFDLQYWTGNAWATLPGGSITGSNRVWTKVTFPSISTSAMRVMVHKSLASWSRITEIEAWGTP